jgi:hypothetical protein
MWGQGGVCDVDDVIPPSAIRRLVVVFYLPIEEHLLVEGEGPCSSEQSSSQAQQTPQDQANNEETQDAPSSDHDNDQDLPSSNEHSPSLDQDQSQNEVQGQAQVENQGQAQAENQGQVHNEDTHSNHDGQGEDPNIKDDQGSSQESIQEAHTHRKNKISATL